VAQVAGRTGRGDRPGRVLVQTFSPDDPAIRHAILHDYPAFVAEELPRRQAHALPPFGRVARLIVRGADPKPTKSFLEGMAQTLRQAAGPELRILGPAEAPIAKIRNLHRFHLQIRAAASGPLHELLRNVLPRSPAPHGVELAVDIDPVSML
jgi:primosomal protein N' (replication factor Y)